MRIAKPLFWTIVLALCAPIALAKDKGFYIGGSLGAASLEQDVADIELDEDEFAYKLFGGYQISGLFAIEGGYVDLGSPSTDVLDTDVDGWNVYAVLGIPLGPLRGFAKAGGIYWDAESDFESDVDDVLDELGVDASDDDFDLAAGLGLELELGSFGVRGEVEYLDVLDGTWLYTVGATITF